MTDDQRLLTELGDALATSREPDPRRIDALRAQATSLDPTPSRPRRAALVMAALAVVAVVAALVVPQLIDDGVTEFDGRLVGADGESTAAVTVEATGIGREIHLRTDDLEILPTGEYYEVWFVSPDDAPGDPDRISAGTFHPDEQGRTDVRLTAAVDPALYPRLEVTAEPGDGDPRAEGPVVLRGEVAADA